jgi:hypothetical protein
MGQEIYQTAPKRMNMTKIVSKKPTLNTHYPCRTSNSLTILKKWILWANKNHPSQKLVIYDYEKSQDYKELSKDSKHLYQIRKKAGYDTRYTVYTTY